MNAVSSNLLFTNIILPQDYKRFGVVSWNDNLTGFSETELYTSLAYA